jgi:Tol biopolymer transport system component
MTFGLSPDGKYLAYALTEGGKQTLSLRQIETTGVVEIVPASEVEYLGASFSFNGAWVLYVSREKGSRYGILYRMPVLGGTATKIVEDVDSPVTQSPDGRALTYVGINDGVSNIWSIPIDGSQPKQLTDWKSDLIYRFAWSADGSLLCERGMSVTDVILIRNRS